MTREVVIVDGARTAFGTLGRTLRNFKGEELGVLGLKGLIAKTQILEKGVTVDSVFMGSAIGPASALNGSRWVVLGSGLPISTAASWVWDASAARNRASVATSSALKASSKT